MPFNLDTNLCTGLPPRQLRAQDESCALSLLAIDIGYIVYISVHVHMCTRVLTYMCTCVHVYMYACVPVCMSRCARVYMCACLYV